MFPDVRATLFCMLPTSAESPVAKRRPRDRICRKRRPAMPNDFATDQPRGPRRHPASNDCAFARFRPRPGAPVATFGFREHGGFTRTEGIDTVTRELFP
jgi:hypothetical protein